MRNPWLRFTILSGTVLVFGLWSSEREIASQSSTASYGVTDLGTLGGTSSAALALDDTEVPIVVGYATTAAGQERGFVGEPYARTALGTLGGASSEARAIQNRTVVGRAQLSGGAYHAFMSLCDTLGGTCGQLMDLGTLGGLGSYATSIETFPTVIVGASQTANNAATRAFVYRDGAMRPLGASLGGLNSVATDINREEQVVGYADLPGGAVRHAFLFADGVTTDLGSLGTSSEAYALNNNGVVVGWSQLASGGWHAFRYDNAAMEDLGTLGGPSSQALDVNGSGAIVGWSETSQGDRHAFVWRDGRMEDLNELIPAGTGWVLNTATGINFAGLISGYGDLNGRRRAFLLTPPMDLRLSVTRHENDLDTNIPIPHEAGSSLTFGVTVSGSFGPGATGVTVVDTISGPVEYVEILGFSHPADCDRDGQRLTCRLAPFGAWHSLFIRVRTTGPGIISHSAAIVAADPPDPNSANNSDSESNRAISLASLTLARTTVVGGGVVLGRTTITSPTGGGGSRIPLASSHPEIASVPSAFDVQGWCCDGIWREFYVRTQPVSAPVTVQISATHGLRTITVPLTILPPGGQWPFGSGARQIPGTIQAEDFDEGAEGAAYHDTGRGNNGGAYRPTDVDIQTTTDGGGGANVGWIAAGEWLEYTVAVASAGTYRLDARVASTGAGGTFHIELDGVNKTGPLTIPNTGGWQAWRTISQAVTLAPGAHVLRVSFDTNGATGAVGNLNYLRITGPTGGGPTPFGGTPRAIPGTIQAEDYDEGGERVAYHDTSSGNSGGQYRY